MADRSAGLHRFFVELVAAPEGRLSIVGPAAHQIARVLRLRPGERIVALDGSGLERVLDLLTVDRHRVEGVVSEVRASIGEPRLRIVLYQGLVARDKLEVVLQKSTEVGVAAIVPVACARSQVPGGDAIDDRRLERWRRIAQEAAEQSRRGAIPMVRSPIKLAEALVEATAAGPTLVAWEGEAQRSVRAALRTVLGSGRPTTPRGHLSLFVGPEGGFADAEVVKATGLGALSVSLGPRILRTETAGPILASIALYEAGEMEPIAPTPEAPV